MTSLDMRENHLFMRNGFDVTGKWDIPVIKKQDIPLDNVRLIAYSDTKQNDRPENTACGVHFFIDDYRFTGIYNNPERSIEKLSQYAFLLTPSILAVSVTDKFKGFITSSRKTAPGCVGFLLILIPQ